MRVRLEKHSRLLLLAERPLASGGEAAIYELPEDPALVAKIYHKPTPEHATKLAAMLATPPADPMADQGQPAIAWPTDRLFASDEAAFVGFVMPRVERAEPILEFFNPRSRLKRCPHFHYGYLLRTARNLAAAVRAVHERDYVIGDLNETNVLVTNQALVTLVDTDSFQVADHEQVYRCHVGKPEYTPPELQQARFAHFDRGPEHDAFALAVLIFQLLHQGVHPFAGRYSGGGEPAELAQRIAAGHWPYACSRPVPYTPPPHAPDFVTLPRRVQELMRRCFEGGHARSVLRPTAGQWQEVLRDAEQELATCRINPQHLWPGELRECPWCDIAHRVGRDPFPRRTKETNHAELPLPFQNQDEILPLQATLAQAATSSPSTSTAPAQRVVPRVRLTPLTFPEPHPPREFRPLSPGSRSSRLRWSDVWPQRLARLLFLVVLIGASGLVVSQSVLAPGKLPLTGSLAAFDFPIGELRRFEGHTEAVESVAVSPDGRLIASGGWDTTLRVWSTDSGQELHRFDGHINAIQGVAFSPDGRRLATASQDLTIRVWDLDTSREVRRLEGHTGAVHAVVFSPDGRRVLSGSSDTTVRLWDVASARELCRLQHHSNAVLAVAMSADGKRGLSAGADHMLWLWDLESGQPLRRLQGHMDFVRGVAFSPDGHHAVSGGDDGTVRLWNLETGQELKRLAGHTDWIYAVAFAPDGRRVVSVSKDRTLRIWNIATEQRTPALDEPLGEAHRFSGPGELRGVAFCPDGRRVLTGGQDHVLRLWGLPR